MSKESATTAEARHGFCTGRLPLFDQIAQGFLKTLAGYQQSSDLFACLDYLDGAVKIDGDCYTRRVVVLAIEDSTQQVEAPPALRREAYAQMRLLKLDPIPELKLYRDLATAILRIDAALHLTKMSKMQGSHGCQPLYH